MLDKEKLFLVMYVDISGVNSSDVAEYLNHFANAFQYDESIERLIIPTREGESRVECINPVLLNKEQYAEVERKIESIKKEVSEALKSLHNDKH